MTRKGPLWNGPVNAPRDDFIRVPTLLSFVPGRVGEFQVGRGEAGSTDIRFDTATEALAFMDAHPYAAMPCWPRLRVRLEGGQ